VHEESSLKKHKHNKPKGRKLTHHQRKEHFVEDRDDRIERLKAIRDKGKKS